ncbi:MAG: nickel transporter permease NikC [Peptococcaceae bacterium BRH_c4b]|nr:MAG: nickel transporter permease NikC [Peptococcaceae bacterium BRH_c4b]
MNGAAASSSLFKPAVVRLCRDPLAMAGLVVISMVVLAALLAPVLSPNDPNMAKLTEKLIPPSGKYPLGTDHLGRCILSRLIYGARVSLGTAAVVLAGILVVGLPVGSLAGYVGGKVDAVIMRLVDVLLAFPGLVLALAVSGMLGPGLGNVMVALGAVWWVEYARIIRGMVFAEREKEYVLAAMVGGTRTAKLLTRHVLPNVLSPVIVMATLDMGKLVLYISALSFLGLGAQPPAAEWGAMLNDGRQYMQVAPMLMVWPGLAIMVVVLAFNLLGDGIRDALDPRQLSRAE